MDEKRKTLGSFQVRMFFVLLTILYSLLISHCGYRLAGRGVSLPEFYWNMAIPVFDNRTPQQDIAQIISLAIIDAFSQRGELTIVPEEQANAVLKGIITSYREQPQNISSSNLASSYRIFITASVRLLNRKTGDVYWQDDKMFFSQDYDVSEYLTQTEYDQIEARRQAAEDFADNLVSVILEGF